MTNSLCLLLFLCYIQGYSYVSPSILFGDNVVSKDIFKEDQWDDTSATPESHRPSTSDVLAARFDESTFFQTYELDLQEPALGDGSFSVCRRCRNRKTQEEFAVKIVSRRVDCGREASLLRACQGHPNVVKLIDVHQDRAHTYIVMELLKGGELLARQKSFTESQARRAMRQLASVVHYMHSRGVVHRDLKPENLVFASDSEDSPVKVVDFGFARMKRGCEPLHTPCFTYPYAAPEVLARQGYDESCDLWSMGAVLYAMLSGSPPFEIASNEFATRAKSGEVDFEKRCWGNVSSLAKKLTRALLTSDPTKRLTAAALTSHPWLATSSSTAASTPSTTMPSHSATATTTTESHHDKPEGFRLREVDGAKLAQRRKLHKRSTSSSVSSSASTTSSSPSVQFLRQVNPAVGSRVHSTTASPAQPSAFDFGEDKVNEYLSSLSSSSDSNSPRIVRMKSKDDAIRALKAKRRKRDMDEEPSSCKRDKSDGPVTRSRKRKLEQNTSSSGSSTESPVSTHVDTQHANVHRKQKAGKRPKRIATIIVE